MAAVYSEYETEKVVEIYVFDLDETVEYDNGAGKTGFGHSMLTGIYLRRSVMSPNQGVIVVEAPSEGCVYLAY